MLEDISVAIRRYDDKAGSSSQAMEESNVRELAAHCNDSQGQMVSKSSTRAGKCQRKKNHSTPVSFDDLTVATSSSSCINKHCPLCKIGVERKERRKRGTKPCLPLFGFHDLSLFGFHNLSLFEFHNLSVAARSTCCDNAHCPPSKI